MAVLHGIEHNGTHVGFIFKCPGCDSDPNNSGYHAVYDHKTGPDAPVWAFDGNRDKPTFTPSILTHVFGREDRRKCHLFIRNGAIEYCGDCYHSMAGKTVQMVDMDGGG